MKKKRLLAKTLIRITGILLIASGAISSLLCFFVMLIYYIDPLKYSLNSISVYAAIALNNSSIILFMTRIEGFITWGYSLLLSILLLRNGILGVRYANQPSRIKFMVKKSILMFFLSAIGMATAFIMHNWTNAGNNASSFIINILFLIGTLLNLQEYTDVDIPYYLRHPLRAIRTLWFKGHHITFSKIMFLVVLILYLAESVIFLILMICAIPDFMNILNFYTITLAEALMIIFNCLFTRLLTAAIGYLGFRKKNPGLLTVSILLTCVTLVMLILSLFIPLIGLNLGIILPILYLLLSLKMKRTIRREQLKPAPEKRTDNFS